MRSLCVRVCVRGCLYGLLLQWVVCRRQTGKVFITQFVENSQHFFSMPYCCIISSSPSATANATIPIIMTICHFTVIPQWFWHHFWYTEFFTTKFIYNELHAFWFQQKKNCNEIFFHPAHIWALSTFLAETAMMMTTVNKIAVNSFLSGRAFLHTKQGVLWNFHVERIVMWCWRFYRTCSLFSLSNWDGIKANRCIH